MTHNNKVLGKSGQPIAASVTLHPGEVLAMELDTRSLKKIDFATNLNIKPSQLSELLHQKRHINAQMAIKLEKLLGIDADFWLRIQMAYDLAIAKREVASEPEKFI